MSWEGKSISWGNDEVFCSERGEVLGDGGVGVIGRGCIIGLVVPGGFIGVRWCWARVGCCHKVRWYHGGVIG